MKIIFLRQTDRFLWCLCLSLWLCLFSHIGYCSHFLAPLSVENRLELALENLSSLKKTMGQNPKYFSLRPTKIVQYDYFTELEKIYNQYRIGELPIESRATFVLEAFSRKDFLFSKENESHLQRLEETRKEIQHFIDELIAHSKRYLTSDGRLNPAGRNLLRQFSSMHGAFSSKDQKFVFNFRHDVGFNIAIERFLLYLSRDKNQKFNELFALHLEFMLQEMDKIIHIDARTEQLLLQEKSTLLPERVFITDIHGGHKRLLSLVAHAFGVTESDRYNHLNSLEDLKMLLLEKNILYRSNGSIKINSPEKNLRFVGLSDIYDRGERPVEVHHVAEWLDSLGMLSFVSGNHDIWRAHGVLAVHRLEKFSEFFKYDDHTGIYRWTGKKDDEGHHIAYWANESLIHSNWATIEIDEINQNRYNHLMQHLRANFGLPTDDIDIVTYRGTQENNLNFLKSRNKTIREGIGENNTHRGTNHIARIRQELGTVDASLTLSQFMKDQVDRNPLVEQNFNDMREVWDVLNQSMNFFEGLRQKEEGPITLDEALAIYEREKGEKHVLSHVVLRFAFGDGTLQGVIDFFNQHRALGEKLKKGLLSIEEFLTLLTAFNTMYPLPDLMSVTDAYLDMALDKAMASLENFIEVLPVKASLLAYIEEKITHAIDQQIDRIRKEYEITLTVLKESNENQNMGGETYSQYKQMATEELDILLKEKRGALASAQEIITRLREDVRQGKISQGQQIATLIAYDFNHHQRVTLKNFRMDTDVRHRALWDLKHTSLLVIDQLGNLYMHGMLPIKKVVRDGQTYFEPDVTFRERRGIKALHAIGAAIRYFFSDLPMIPDFKAFREVMWQDIGDALTIQNDLYSDRTQTAKAKTLNKIQTGEEGETVFDTIKKQAIANNYGDKPVVHMRSYIALGHTTTDARERDNPWWKGNVMNFDLDLSTGYANAGGLGLFDVFGAYRKGFAHGEASEITDLTHIAHTSLKKSDPGVFFKDIKPDSPHYEDARRALLEMDRSFMIKDRYVSTVDALIAEYEGLLAHAQREGLSFQAGQHEKKLRQLRNKYSFDHLNFIRKELTELAA